MKPNTIFEEQEDIFHITDLLPSKIYKMGEGSPKILYGRNGDTNNVEKFQQEGRYDRFYHTVMEPHKPYEAIIVPGGGEMTFNLAIDIIKQEGYEEVHLRDLLHIHSLAYTSSLAAIGKLSFLVASATQTTKEIKEVNWSCVPVLSLPTLELSGVTWRSLGLPADYGVVGLRKVNGGKNEKK